MEWFDAYGRLLSTRFDAIDIKYLFHCVLFSLDPIMNSSEVKCAIRNISKAYRPDQSKLLHDTVEYVDYNDLSHQYAYLHRYAPFHTVMVLDLMNEILSRYELNDFWINWMSYFQTVNICSLGGGPGTDIIGVLGAFYQQFGLRRCSSTLVDVKPNWKNIFAAILYAMRHENFRNPFQIMTPEFFRWNFVVADLMGDEMHCSTINAIRSANFITMIKFLSAAACTKTVDMVKKIFNLLRPGSLVLYIDNAAGGFTEKLYLAADECNMRTVYGPVKHMKYTNDLFNIERYGYRSCSSTTITVVLLLKNFT